MTTPVFPVGTVFATAHCGGYFSDLDGFAKEVAACGDRWVVVTAGFTPAFESFENTQEMYTTLVGFVVGHAVSTLDALAALQNESAERIRTAAVNAERRESEAAQREAQRVTEHRQEQSRRARRQRALAESNEREAAERERVAARMRESAERLNTTPVFGEPRRDRNPLSATFGTQVHEAVEREIAAAQQPKPPANHWQRADRKIVLREDDE